MEPALKIEQVNTLLSLAGKRVRRLRDERVLTRKQLAHTSRVSERHLAQLELGRSNISLALLDRIALALDTSVANLVGHEEPARTDEQRLMGDIIQQLKHEQQPGALNLLRNYLSSLETRNNRIALVGLRGAGKSTLGRRLARERKLPFIRLRSEIEKQAGMDVGEILELSGQAGYHHLENLALESTLERHPECVIETSGNIVGDSNLYDRLLSTCTVVWIQALPELHMQRVIDQGDLRPMADNDDAMGQLRRILKDREPLYAQAQRILDTSNQTPDQSFRSLKNLLQ